MCTGTTFCSDRFNIFILNLIILFHSNRIGTVFCLTKDLLLVSARSLLASLVIHSLPYYCGLVATAKETRSVALVAAASKFDPKGGRPDFYAWLPQLNNIFGTCSYEKIPSRGDRNDVHLQQRPCTMFL